VLLDVIGGQHMWTTRRRIYAVGVTSAAMTVASVGAIWNFASAEETTLGNNLSVPVIVAPSATAEDLPVLRGGACGEAVTPVGPISTTFPDYYLQKTTAVWQAACSVQNSATAIINWGDNLTMRPVLSARQPVRIEVALENTPIDPMTGFVVDKLTPELEDRFAIYGTRGVPTDFPTVRVFDSGARLRIERLDGPDGVVYDGPIAAEVNSVGAIVYGFNWGIKGRTERALPGTYRITFFTNRVNLSGVDSSDQSKASFTRGSSSLVITLAASAGKRGRTPDASAGNVGQAPSGSSGSGGQAPDASTGNGGQAPDTTSGSGGQTSGGSTGNGGQTSGGSSAGNGGQ
jgi:hypothetical protein